MSAPRPDRRGEPSPLPLHLAAALSGYAQALLAAPRAAAPEFPWSPELAPAAAALGPDLDRLEIAREIAARLRAMVQGVEAWQSHPYRRRVEEPPAIWCAGAARLLDYGATPEASDPSGPPVLVIPSLINRAYILDLGPDWSMLRWLAAQGLRPALLDWGAPGREEARFSLDDYGARRLAPALRALQEASGRPAALLGYCMGGGLAAGLAARRPEGLAALVTIGAPWDFASALGFPGGLRAAIRAEGPDRVSRELDALGQAFGMIPVQTFQALFALVSPMQAAIKFQKFARLDPDNPAARRFVAVEDWLADGAPLPAPAARTLLIDWLLRNHTATGRWEFLGGPVDPAAIRVPALVFCGRGDAIAPPTLARPLAAAISGAALEEPATGHVGMIVGSTAPERVWRPVADFLLTHAG